MDSITAKKNNLIRILRQYGRLIIAFSGGVDSSFLLALARDVLGDKVIAVTSVSPVHSLKERHAAIHTAQKLGATHILMESKEMALKEFTDNTKDRCYICKKNMISSIKDITAGSGISIIAHGANTDDLNDYRPGQKAAEEMGIAAPLMEAGLAKNDIRMLSKEMGLDTWDAPSDACLATRIPYGTEITEKNLKMTEQAEDILRDMGFVNCRVRHHGTVARIEVGQDDIERIVNEPIRAAISDRLKKQGYSYIAVDLEGYVKGSMNRVL